MPCDFSTPVQMAQAGMTEAEIELLEKEIQLARAKAQKLASDTRMTAIQQRAVMEAAEFREREIAHDRFHRRLEDESKEFFNKLANVLPEGAKKHGS